MAAPRGRQPGRLHQNQDLDAIVAENGSGLSGTSAFLPNHGVSRQSSVHSQISGTIVGYTPQPMEGVLIGNSHNKPSLVPNSSLSSATRTDEFHLKVA